MSALTISAISLALTGAAEPKPDRSGAQGESRPVEAGCKSLKNGWCAPVVEGVFAGYVGDTGLDLLADKKGVVAVADGVLEYAEHGHTRWTSPPDTPNSARIRLDVPLVTKKCRVTHVYYTHMSELSVHQPADDAAPQRIGRGDRIGLTGIGNRVPHLHLGLICEGRVAQETWDDILREDEVRAALGGYLNGARL